jgi:hypothetical protein
VAFVLIAFICSISDETSVGTELDRSVVGAELGDCSWLVELGAASSSWVTTTNIPLSESVGAGAAREIEVISCGSGEVIEVATA